jgi:NAD(P)H-hydrate epimerase
MKVLTAAQMREVDRRTTEEYGIPSLQLMENAGTRVVEVLLQKFADLSKRRTVILCGKGNNGGDGFVVARLLRQRGCNPAVCLFGTPDTVKGDAAINLTRWQESGGTLQLVTSEAEWACTRASLDSAEIVLDALLGTGLSGPVEGLLRLVIEDVNRLAGKATIVAVDIPSGLPSDTGASYGPAVRAHLTVTLTALKVGQVVPPNCLNVGELVVRPIGSPEELWEKDPTLKYHLLEPQEFSRLPLLREAAAHKGDFGHALIVAGSRGKTGAAVLAAWGALRTGAGLVTVATPDSVLPIVAAGLPEMMTEPLLSTEVGSISVRNLDYGRFGNLQRDKAVLALGPGLSQYDETQQFVRVAVAQSELPAIVDADGLNAFAGRSEELISRKTAHLMVTPHPGEMSRLIGITTKEIQARRLEVALEAAARWNAVVVLKGYRTVIAAPDGTAYINPTGNPGMATGGTGDVLTGMLAGLTAVFGTRDWPLVAGLGVYLHGLAGDIASTEVGQPSLVASDLVRAISSAYRRVLSELGHA